MHPALSVIFFTTLSGAGYGMATLLSLGLGNPDSWPTKVAWIIALGMITLGLLSSTLHLGNPQRFLYALTQWRSSWLSREGCLAIIAYVPLLIQVWSVVINGEFIASIGAFSAVLCMVIVFCTSMIYASLKTVPAWNTDLTPAVYIAFSIAGGMLFAHALQALEGHATWLFEAFTLVMLIIAWLARAGWRSRAESIGTGDSTVATATGLGDGTRLLERPHATENYLTREMGFRVARKHATKLWHIALLLGLVVPGLILVLSVFLANSAIMIILALLALPAFLAGSFVERWLFFATAKHTVSLYYGIDDDKVAAGE